MPSQQAFYSSPNEVASTRSSAGLEPPPSHYSQHGGHQSMNLTNGLGGLSLYPSSSAQQQQSLLLQPKSQHSRAASLPAFSLQQAQQAAQQQQQGPLAGLGAGLGGFGAGGYGLGVSSEGTLPGWAEEEVA